MRYVCAAAAALVGLSVLTPSWMLGQGPAGLSIANYQLVGQQQISGNQFNYTYRANLVNSGGARSAITAQVTSGTPDIQIVDGNLHFTPVPANSQVTSTDTFTILIDRTQPVDFASLQWSFVAPFAVAGPNQTAGVQSTVTLNGSGSSNPSGIGSLAYNWTFLSRPPGSSARITNATTVISSFVLDVPGIYIVSLTVSNGAGEDSAALTVSTTNSPPVANAGPNQTVAGGATVILNGGGSTDVNGDPLTYAWTLTTRPGGSTAALTGAATVSPTFLADRAGTYVAQLIVNDGNASSAPATVTITTLNSPPVANAGANQAGVAVGALTQLNGAGSTDVDGDALTYQWSLIGVPNGSTAALSNPAIVNPTFPVDRAGTFVAQLIVSDGTVNSAPATVTITTTVILAPAANAGPDQTVTHGALVTLNGGGTDPQGRPLTFQWSLISRPVGSAASLSGTSVAQPTLVADRPGTYVAQLIVNNGFLNGAPDTVTITTTNTAPVANPGPAQSVAAGALVTLNGIASSDANGDPLSFSWSFTSRPAGSTAALSAATSVSPTFTADVLGTYVVQLIVSDAFTSGAPATVTVTAVARTITLTPDPLSLLANTPGILTVALAAPAGPSGQQVTLAAVDPSVVNIPSNVLVPANQTSINVTVTPGAVGATAITGSAPGFRPGTTNATVTVPTISVALTAGAVGVARNTTGTVTLSGPSPNNTTVNLTPNPAGIVTVQPNQISIPAGGTTGTFTVTGAAEGTAAITASAAGYTSGPAAQIAVVSVGLISLQATGTLGPGQSAPLLVSLLTPAPVGGVTIALVSGDTSRVTIAPATVAIAAGATTPATQPQVTGVSFGSATITASAPGLLGDTETVNVTASLSFSPQSIAVGAGGTQNLTLNLSVPAPAGGLAVNLTSNPATVATVPANVVFAQGETGKTVPVTGVGAGSATITATSAIITGANANVTVVVLGSITLPVGGTVGLGQSTPVQVALSANAPLGGVTVSLVSGDTSRATVSPSSANIAAGSNSPAAQPQITGTNIGQVTITAAAPGFGTATRTLQVTASFTFSPPSATITGTATQNLTLTLSGPAPVGGLTVNLSSDNTTVATVPAAVNIAQNTTTATVPVTGVGAGSTAIRANATGIPQATANVTVQPAGAIGLPANVRVGPGQAAAFPVTLPSPAPSNLTVSLVSANTSRVTVSPASVTVLAGQTQPAVQPQVTGVNFGAAAITATAPGYAAGSQTVQVGATLSFTPASVAIPGPVVQNVTLNLSAAAPAGGLVVTLASSNAGVATVPAFVTIPQNTASVNVPISGSGAGSAIITASSVAANVVSATANVTVQGLGGIGLPAGITVGLGQSVPLPVTLPVPAPAGGVTVTLTSGNAATVTVSPLNVVIAAGQTQPAQQPQITGAGLGTANINASAPGYGAGSQPVQVTGTMGFTPPALTLNAPGPQNLTLTVSGPAPAGGLTIALSSANTNVATVPATVTIAQGATTAAVPVTGLTAGSTVITASATTLGQATANVTVTTADIILPADVVVAPGASTIFTVSLARPAQQTTFVSLVSGDPTRATLTLSNIVINTGQTHPASQPRINGLSAGTVTITASSAGLATATAPVVVGFRIRFVPADLTLNRGTSQNLTLTLSSPAPAGGFPVSLTSNATGIATVPASASFLPSTTTINVRVTGIALGTALIRATAAGLPDATGNVTVVAPGAIVLPANASVELGKSAAFPVALSTPAPPGGATVALTSANIRGLTVSHATVFIPGGETQPAVQPQVSGVNVGGFNVSATALGFTSATATVQVRSTILFTTQNVTVQQGSSGILLLALSASAPWDDGLVVNLISGSPTVARVQTVINFYPDGSEFTTVVIPVTGLASGTSVIRASGINIPEVTTTVTVVGPVNLVTASLANGSVGAPYSQPLVASGGVPPYAFARTAGILPNGLALNPSTGEIAGTPTVAVVNTPLTFRVTDSSSPAGTSARSMALTIGQQVAASITATSGTPQSAAINTAFANRLVATVQDSSGNPVNGALVTFTAPATGPRGTFAGGANTAVTNASGVATSAMFTANSTAGSYAATAAVAAVATPASFALTNTAGPAASIAATGGTPQSAPINTAFASPLVATVRDAGNNPVAGATVTFATPATGARGTFAGGLNTAVTNASGVATSAVFTANGTAGAYAVVASVPGAATPATFALTNTAGSPASIAATGGTPQGAPINTAFPNRLVATVRDGGGNPLSGVTVAFAAPATGAGGAFAGGVNTAVTNASGVATSAVFSANGTAGAYSVTAAVSGVATPASFALTNNAGAAASIVATGGTPQSAPVGTAFSSPLVATVRDAGGNPVSGATVTFTVPGAPPRGTFAGGANTAVTNAAGVATSAAFTANGTAGSYIVAASVAGVAAPANFALTNTAGAPASITATSGGGQSTVINTVFANRLTATVRDAGGNLVVGATVTFTAPATGARGTFAGGANTAVTNASGVATSAMFTANGTAGPYNVTASAAGVATPAGFALTNTAGPAASIAATSGTPQSAVINMAFAAQLVATVRDEGGNPVGGATVTFTAPAAGARGNFTGGVNTAVTNAAGAATSAVFTANGTAGAYAVSATVPGAPAPASFALTNTAGAAASITATSGLAQTAAIGTAFANPLVATVRDAGGNPVGGATVTFTPPATGARGTFAGGANTAITNALGVATSAVVTANNTAGTYAMVASVTGVVVPASFALTNSSGPAASITATSGGGQSAIINAAFAARLVATVRDAGGNPVNGATVTFTPPAAGASAGFAGGVNTAVTNAAGAATSAVFSANGTAGPYSVTAAAAGVATQAGFGLTNNAGPAASITAISGAPQSAPINTAFANRLVATVRDASGNPVTGATVTFTAPGAGARGTFAGGANTAVTNASGVATSAVVTANAIAGSYAVTAAVAGVATPASFALTNTAGPAAAIMATSGSGQSTSVNSAFVNRLVATVRDAGGNFVSGATVTFTAPASGASGAFVGGVNTALTNASGVATSAVFTANSVAGSYNVTASVPGAPTPAGFALTNTSAGPPLAISGASVGQHLQAQIFLTLPQPASPGGQVVTITSGNESQLLIAGRPGDPGVNQLPVTVGEGLTIVGGIFVQALGNSGTVQVAASGPGFTTGTATVTLTPSGFVLAGPGGIGAAFPLSQGSGAQLTVSASRLDSSLNFVEVQQVRGGASFPVDLSNSAPFEGTVSPGSVTIVGGIAAATATFTATPGAVGSAVLTAVVPPGFGQPAQGRNSVTATFVPSGLVAPNMTIGRDLQRAATITLNSPAPGGGLPITIASLDAQRLRFSTTPQGAGLESITLNVQAGRTTTLPFYVYGLESSGSPTYTAMGAGFGTAIGTVTLTPSGFAISGPNGLGADFFTTVGAGNSDLTVFAARLDSAGNYAEQQPVRGGISVNVDVTSSNAAVGVITAPTVTFNNGSGSATTQFNPASQGNSLLEVGVPAGFTAPSQHRSLTATVRVPVLIVTDTTIGRNLQTVGTVLLGEPAPPGGVVVTLTSLSAQLLLSTVATAAGTASIEVTVPAGQSSATYFLQAFADSGVAGYTASAPSFAADSGNVTMRRSGVVITGPFGFGSPEFSAILGEGNRPVTVYTALLNASDAFLQIQPLAGGLSLEVMLRSSVPEVGTITSPVTIAGGSESVIAQFTPVAVGETNVSALRPEGYTLPSNNTALTARVN